MAEVHSRIDRKWETDRPKLSEVQQLLRRAVKAGAVGDDAFIEVSASEGQYGKSYCHMIVHWTTRTEE